MKCEPMFFFCVEGDYSKIRDLLYRFTPTEKHDRFVACWENTASDTGEDSCCGHIVCESLEDVDNLLTAFVRPDAFCDTYAPDKMALDVRTHSNRPAIGSGVLLFDRNHKPQEAQGWLNIRNTTEMRDLVSANPDAVFSEEWKMHRTFVAAFDVWFAMKTSPKIGDGDIDSAFADLVSARNELQDPDLG